MAVVGLEFAGGEGTSGALLALAVVAAAAVGAFLAGASRIPKPAGYLLGGIIIGPSGLGLVTDRHEIALAAEIGVALLLFAIGLELSLRELGQELRRATLIGLGQALVVGAVVVVGANALGVSPGAALVLGGAAGLSSTAAGVATLNQPGARTAALASVAIGTLIVQDVLAAVIIASVPALGAGTEVDALAVALLGVGAALAGVLAVLPLAAWLCRVALAALARRVDRELFLVVTLAGVGAAAAGAAILGLSAALGAFVAGLLIRQSGYGEQALAETGSLRTTFAAIFFVSLGLLFRPGILLEETDLVVLLLVSVTLVKFVAIASLGRAGSLPWGAAVLLGLILANAGEFSFVVVDVADPELLAEGEVSALVFAVVTSVLVSSALVGLGGWRGARRVALEGAVVVVGYGRAGRSLVRAMGDRWPVAVVEREAAAAALASADGHPVIWGDILQLPVVGRLKEPRALVVTPGGAKGIEIVEGLARSRLAEAKIIALSSPPRPASLNLDLAVVEADRRLASTVMRVIEDSLKVPFESPVLRTPGGVVRYDLTGRPPPAEEQQRPLARFLAWWAPRPGDCKECSGRGRRYTWPVTRTCDACGGSGRAS